MDGFKYAPHGGATLTTWAEAAAMGGTTPAGAAPGVKRTYNVDAYLDVEGKYVRVSGTWLSEMPDDVRRATLKALGLPLRKSLFHRDGRGVRTYVGDLRVSEVYEDWFGLELLTREGRRMPFTIHHMYLSEMNSGRLPYPAEFYVFDLETTGLDVTTSEVAEIAALKVVDGQVTGEFSTTVHIDGEMPPEAREVNHITDEELAAAPHMRAAFGDFSRFVGRSPILVGHNIESYDLPIIRRVALACGRAFRPKGSIDTLSLAKRAWPDERHGMDALRRKLSLTGDDAHRALKDCHDELAVYLAALDELESHPERRRGDVSAARREQDTSPKGSVTIHGITMRCDRDGIPVKTWVPAPERDSFKTRNQWASLGKRPKGDAREVRMHAYPTGSVYGYWHEDDVE